MLDLPQPNKLGESSVLARARQASSAHAQSSAQPVPGADAKGSRAPWLVVGLVALGLAMGFAGHYWAWAETGERGPMSPTLHSDLSEDTPGRDL